MSKLVISNEFFRKLDAEDNKRILRIYGYNSKEEFLKACIRTLNENYNFLNIDGWEFLTSEEKRVYNMYNGYIRGEFKDYDLITVSFTTIIGKSGNVFFNQQVVPMITSKLQDDIDFLLNPRIKKICLLTTHKSKKMAPEANVADEDSLIQVSINFANTIGFEFLEVFPMKGIDINGRYRDVLEIIEHTRYLQRTKPRNSQYLQVYIENNTIFGSFENTPKGQEAKFFALKMYAIAFLNIDFKINILKALDQTRDYTIEVLSKFIDYVQTIDPAKRKLNEFIMDMDLDSIETSEERLEENISEIPEYKIPPQTTFNSKGKKVYITKKKYKEKSMEVHHYLCACNDEKHFYFTSSATGKNYLEGHHMIPMENQAQYWKEKEINLDCTLNIIPLCPHCHGKIHKAIPAEKIEIISLIYNRYKEALTEIDHDLNLSKFAALYNVYIY